MSGKTLISIEKINAVTVFTEDGTEELLKQIEAKVAEFTPNTSTAKGRKDIASMAYKVSQSKTLLDNLGKELVSDWKKKAGIVDKSRKAIKDRCDQLRDGVRLPLDEWEKAEAARKEKIKLAKEISDAWDIAHAENENRDKQKELDAKLAEIAQQEEEKRQAEAAEEAERQRLEREETIRREATEKAAKDAEEALEKERAESIRREAEAKIAADNAERDRLAAIETARIEKENAVKEAERKAREEADRKEGERLRQEAEAKRQAQAKAADLEHRKTINNAALTCLMDNGCSEAESKRLITLIACGKIAHITINY